MKDPLSRRPQLALPYTILTEPDTVRLVCGEDFRYTLTGPGLEGWLPGLLAALDGQTLLGQAFAALAEARRAGAREVIERLFGERVLVEGPASWAPADSACRLLVTGTGALVAALGTAPADSTASPLQVFCQDRLDYEAALQFNRRGQGGTDPWLWATYGPSARAYVSPVFLPDAGPCLACLLRQFQLLSPAPEFYDALGEQARRSGRIEPVPFPPEALPMLAGLVRWKAALLGRQPASVALFRLHVLEVETLEVSSHCVFTDPECPACAERP
jgi:bacteriocin biosynthesis cyclodehydratase domain-containing protein